MMSRKQTIKRLFSYITTKYKMRFLFVLFCILLSTFAGVAGSLFLQVLIDDYIAPLLNVADPDFSGLRNAVFIMAGI